MFTSLLEWAFKVVVASLFLLLFSVLLSFVWNSVMKVFHGPTLSFFDIALLAFLAAIAVGNWSFALLSARAANT